MEKVKILVFAGSLRKDALSKKFAKAAAELAKEQGADVNFIELNDYQMPLYNEDLKAGGFDPKARGLKQLIYDSDAVIICTPEYNRSIPGALKNAIDWISRKMDAEDPNNCLDTKPVLLLSSSPGAFGGILALFELRHALIDMKPLILGQQMTLPMAGDAFDEAGMLKDEKRRAALESNVKKLLEITEKIKV